MKRLILPLLVLTLSAPFLHGQTVIRLGSENGVPTLPARINGVAVKTYFTPESWYVSLSATTFLFLHENGYISDEDVKGTTSLKLLDGSTVKAVSFEIRELDVDGLKIKHVPAVVIKKQTVPFLVGSTAFQSLGEIEVSDRQLVIRWDDWAAYAEKAEKSVTDSLKNAVQQAIEEKDYAAASTGLGKLYQADELDMFTLYQYCMVLALNGQDRENIRVSQEWAEQFAGKSLYMDYWIYDGLGDSARNIRDNAAAITWYTQALEACYRLYNTSEKEIAKGHFHDGNAGRTLFALGQAYAAEGKLSKGEFNCVLSARCGYEPAIEFCRKYKLKY